MSQDNVNSLFYLFKLQRYCVVRREELENRLIDFSIDIYKICSLSSNSEFGRNLTKQLSRSATSPALNYAEAQSAESSKDFIHKLSIALKELRETFIILRILEKSGVLNSNEKLIPAIKECNELIAIFVSSIKTLQKK